MRGGRAGRRIGRALRRLYAGSQRRHARCHRVVDVGLPNGVRGKPGNLHGVRGGRAGRRIGRALRRCRRPRSVERCRIGQCREVACIIGSHRARWTAGHRAGVAYEVVCIDGQAHDRPAVPIVCPAGGGRRGHVVGHVGGVKVHARTLRWRILREIHGCERGTCRERITADVCSRRNADGSERWIIGK